MDRLFVCILVAVVCSLTSGAVIEKRDVEENSTSICGQNPCPSFTVIKNLADGIEKRQYSAFSAPAYTSVACMSFSNALIQGYFHLSMYTRAGLNQENRRLPMGVPVMTEVKYVDDVDEKCSWIYTTLFYVSDETLPTPKNPDIKIQKIQEIPEQCFYVLTFSGFTRNHQDKVVELREKLNAMKLSYDSKKYFIATYQSPNSLLNRRNEIWLPAEDC